MPQSIVIIF